MRNIRNKNTTFRKMDLLPSSGEKVGELPRCLAWERKQIHFLQLFVYIQ
jgi:hypothetical protein